MPIWFMGKRREALTGNSEVYKRYLVRFLEKRGFYLKASSDVEATFPDCILIRKDSTRESWLEAKATTISLGESSFLSQLGKYLAKYLIRAPTNKFNFILACYSVRDRTFFERVFIRFEAKAIKQLVNQILEISEFDVKRNINESSPEEIKSFLRLPCSRGYSFRTGYRCGENCPFSSHSSKTYGC